MDHHLLLVVTYTVDHFHHLLVKDQVPLLVVVELILLILGILPTQVVDSDHLHFQHLLAVEVGEVLSVAIVEAIHLEVEVLLEVLSALSVVEVEVLLWEVLSEAFLEVHLSLEEVHHFLIPFQTA